MAYQQTNGRNWREDSSITLRAPNSSGLGLRHYYWRPLAFQGADGDATALHLVSLTF